MPVMLEIKRSEFNKMLCCWCWNSWKISRLFGCDVIFTDEYNRTCSSNNKIHSYHRKYVFCIFIALRETPHQTFVKQLFIHRLERSFKYQNEWFINYASMDQHFSALVMATDWMICDLLYVFPSTLYTQHAVVRCTDSFEENCDLGLYE